MTTVKERIEDVSWKYLYVNNWTWHESYAAEEYNGHPRTGEIYRAVYNDKTRNYKLVLPTGNAPESYLVVDKLNDSDEAASSSLTEISKENIVKLNLSETALDQLLSWQESAKQDMAKIYGKKKAPNRMIQMEPSDEEKQVMAGALNLINAVYNTNTPLFAILMDVIQRLHKYDMQKPTNTMTTLTLSKGASGVNVHQALGNLEEYTKPIKQGGDDRDNIVYAIIHLFTELQRRLINNLDD